MMYEKYVLCSDSLKNVVQNGETTGFSLQIRIPYYRCVPLSMVEDLKVIVDGQESAVTHSALLSAAGPSICQKCPL